MPLLYWKIIIAFFILLAIYAYLTNPFVRFSLVLDPYKEFALNSKAIAQAHRLRVRWRRFFKFLALVKAGWHIVVGSFSRPYRARGEELNHICENIHALRFNPRLPFLISGDHFSVLYPRSLGIFFYVLLDPRIPSSDQDWLNRQLIYTKTLLYALSVYEQTKQLSTTIVPITRGSVALMNIYAYPSDTLYSLLTALENLASPKALTTRYPFETELSHKLATKQVAKKILTRFSESLSRHWQQFAVDVYDTETGLIKKSWRLSGTKDIAKRESAFYDNVMYWRTWQLAQELGLTARDPQGLKELKNRIFSSFWNSNGNHFYEDLSERGLQEGWNSSDWLIAYQTGFLSPDTEADLPYLINAVETIWRDKTDQPFGLCYHKDVRPFQLYLPVRLGAPLYGSSVIWSHWGIEYIKLLAHLTVVTEDTKYLQRAREQLAAYHHNIISTKGYPEVYDPQGQPYRHWLYSSVHQTGWVINFEQAREMVEAVQRQFVDAEGLEPPTPAM